MNKKIINELRSIGIVLCTIHKCQEIDSKIKFSIKLIQLVYKYFPHSTHVTNKCEDILIDKIINIRLGQDKHHSLMKDYQLIKKYQQNTGNFWQDFFSLFKGWKNLGTGDKSGLDLYNEEKKIYIELKNRYNTDNYSAKKKNIEKLQRKSKDGYRVVYGVINEKNSTGKYVEYDGYSYVSGEHLFKLICGNPTTVYNITNIIPLINT